MLLILLALSIATVVLIDIRDITEKEQPVAKAVGGGTYIFVFSSMFSEVLIKRALDAILNSYEII